VARRCRGHQPLVPHLKVLGYTLPNARAFEARLRQIAEIFRTSPVWNPPMGVDPALTGMAFGPDAYTSPFTKKLTYGPIAGYMMMGSFEHFEVIRTIGGQEQHERQVGDETSHIIFDVNALPRGAGVNPVLRKNRTRVHCGPSRSLARRRNARSWSSAHVCALECQTSRRTALRE
jgi:hypothetical protein